MSEKICHNDDLDTIPDIASRVAGKDILLPFGSPMTWTRKRPVVPGWYWYKQQNVEPIVLRLSQARGSHGRKLCVEGVLMTSVYRGYWCGPLDIPK